MTAEEKFNSLGYEMVDTGDFIYYYLRADNEIYIRFSRYKEKVYIHTDKQQEFCLFGEELLAIQQQIEELENLKLWW